MVDEYDVSPEMCCGIFTPLEHAVCGQHLSTVELLWGYSRHIDGFWTDLTRARRLLWLMATPIHKYDKLFGHMINCGDENKDIKKFIERKSKNAGFTAIELGIGMGIVFAIGIGVGLFMCRISHSK